MPLPETSIAPSDAPGTLALPKLMIVGDPAKLNVAGEALIELELGWEVIFAASAFDAHDIPSLREIDVILIDLGNPHVEGVDLTESLHTLFPHTPIVLMSAPFAVSVAMEATRRGATNHFPRSLLDSEPAAVLATLSDAAESSRRRKAALARRDNVYFEYTLDNDRSQVSAVVASLAEAVVESGLCDPTAARRLGVAVEECLVNAIVHGNLEMSGDLGNMEDAAFERWVESRREEPPYRDRHVRLTAKVGRNEAVFVVKDAGRGFDVAALPDPTDLENPGPVGGRGIMLMRSFMSAVHFTENGTRVTLVKRRKS